MTEQEANETLGSGNVRVHRVATAEVDRAVIDRATEGMVKIVADRKGRILGAHVVASNASTMIEELVLARKKGVRVGALAQLVSPYPSLADGVQKAAAGYWEAAASGVLGRMARAVAGWSA